MPIRQRFDYLLLGAAILQTAIGLAILASASWLIAIERYHRVGSYFVAWQAATAFVGLVLLVMAMHLKTELLSGIRATAVAVAACWLMLVGALAQAPVANAHRWLSVAGLSVQPSVLARLAIILFTAYWLSRARASDWSLRHLAPVALVCAITTALVGFAPDLGSAALIVLVVAAMTFVAGVPLRLLVAPAVACFAALAVGIVSSPYRLQRVLAFIGSDNASAVGWQSYQSLVAAGSGGLVGRGYGAGLQKLFFLPEPHTDFIYSITGEELGLVGMVALLGLSAVIVWRGMRIALAQARPERALLAFGLTFAFAAQALIHMVVCLDLLPPKGIPLPLVSYGKTDLMVSLTSIGLLLNLSRVPSGAAP
jgi:cell division protein FtsW